MDTRTDELKVKLEQAAAALEALDDHLNERINAGARSIALTSASNRLYTT